MKASVTRVRNAHLAAAAGGLGRSAPGALQGLQPSDVGRFRPMPSLLATVMTILALSQTDALLRAETALSAAIGRVTGTTDAVSTGRTVLFAVDGEMTSYTLTLACSAVFLLLPFLVVTAVLTGVRRVRARAAFAALGLAGLTITGANQLRIAVIATAMQVMGPQEGYAVTHVMVGTIVSTLGTVAAGGVYLFVLLRGSRGVQRG